MKTNIINLFRAEWLKITGHRRVVTSMLWIFPTLAVITTVLGMIAAAVSPGLRASLNDTPQTWIDMAIYPWGLLTDELVLILLIGFTAVVFGGEYQWKTLNLIVPRTQRVPLILTKFVTVAVLIMLPFLAMSVLLPIGIGLVSIVAGAPYGPSIDANSLRTFVGDYGLSMLSGFLTVAIASAITALAAMVTRSILGSAIVGIIAFLGHAALLQTLDLLAALFNVNLQHLYRLMPLYAIEKLSTRWLNASDEFYLALELQDGTFIEDSPLFLVTMLAVWMIGLVSLTAYLFQRQDVAN